MVAIIEPPKSPFSRPLWWRECVGVEPTQERETAPATVLKTARPTGTQPLPRDTDCSLPQDGSRAKQAPRRYRRGAYCRRFVALPRVSPPACSQASS